MYAFHNPIYKAMKEECRGCKKIWKRINEQGQDGVFICPVCGKEIEWGT